MNYYALIGLFNGVVVLFGAAGIFLKRSSVSFYRSFLIFSCCIGVWSIFYAVWQIQTEHDAALFWMRLAMLGVYPSCFGFLWFVMDLCGIEKNKTQKLLLIVLPVLFSLFTFSPLMVRDVAPQLIFPFWPVPGLLMPLYTFLFVSSVLLSFILLTTTYFRSVGSHRWQIKWVIFTMAPAWFGGSTNWLLWYGINFPPAPNFFVGVGWLLLCYAMIRIRLFDADVLADYVQEARLSAIGLLTSSIHHEIKSPVFVMKGSAETCLEKLQTSGFETKEDAERAFADLSHKILDQSQRVLEIIRSFRDMAKRQTGKRFEARPVLLRQTLENIMPLLKNELDSNHVHLQIEISNELQIYADPYSVEEIFLNLILNACQALRETQNSKIVLTGSVLAERGLTPMVLSRSASRQSSVVSPSSIVVTIADNGPGINALDINRIFEPFYTTKETGTGLGLYVVRELIRRNGGEISVQSAKPQGTSVRLKFKGVWKIFSKVRQ